MSHDPAEIIEEMDFRYAKTRRLLVGVIYDLDEIMKKRGANRANYRYRFIRKVGRNFDNLIDEVGACNETEISEQATRIEKMESSITKLLKQLKAQGKALAATREELEKAKKELEKCPETASTPNST